MLKLHCAFGPAGIRTQAERSRRESDDGPATIDNNADGRFPSPKVDSDQFLRIASWHNMPDSEASTKNSSRDIAGTMRSWYRSMSRRKIFIILVILLIILFVAAVILTIFLVVLPSHNNNNHDFTAIVFTMTTPSTTMATTPSPYPTGYVVGTVFRYVPAGVAESLVPDNRGFAYKRQLLTWGNDTISMFDASIITQGELHLERNECESCALLTADDDCLIRGTVLHCNQSQAIYCCSNCPKVGNLCRVKGILYEFSDQLVEYRISTNGGTLLFTTASHPKSTHCAVQIHRVGSDGSTFSGPIQSCYKVDNSKQKVQFEQVATTTSSPDFSTSADILIGVDTGGSVLLYNLTSETSLAYLPMEIGQDLLSISTTIQEDRLLVAFLQQNRFYVFRYNFVSNCVSVLEGYYQKFDYSGELRDFSWADDNLIVWYVDRQGVNVVEFQFKWHSDNVC